MRPPRLSETDPGGDPAILCDEGAADADGAASGAQGVGLAQDDADGRQDGDVQDGVELRRQVGTAFEFERNAAVAKVDHARGAALPSFLQHGVRFGAGERYALEFARHAL